MILFKRKTKSGYYPIENRLLSQRTQRFSQRSLFTFRFYFFSPL